MEPVHFGDSFRIYAGDERFSAPENGPPLNVRCSAGHSNARHADSKIPARLWTLAVLLPPPLQSEASRNKPGRAT
jgi:hypothetical protein